MTFGERIVAARIAAGLNQRQLAEMLGISPTRLNYWEKDKRQPDVSMIKALAQVLSTTGDYLIDNADVEQKLLTPLAGRLTKEQREYVEKYYALNPEGRERVHATINFELAKQQGARKTVTEITQPPKLISFPQETVTLIEPSMPVCAGAGNYLDDNIEYEERKVLKNKYTYGASYIIKLQGDSMEPEFHDGDRLIVTDARGHSPIYGRVGIFIINGDAFFRQPLGGVLHPYNSKYADIVPGESDDVRYVGYVVGIIDDSWVIE